MARIAGRITHRSSGPAKRSIAPKFPHRDRDLGAVHQDRTAPSPGEDACRPGMVGVVVGQIGDVAWSRGVQVFSGSVDEDEGCSR